ncbi:MAG: PhoH family protein [Firmicutes bacterium]|nr:PhoH family protein [Bacillota bacterium]MCL5064812.1 PhoH family protein [Bacillota bacterium]
MPQTQWVIQDNRAATTLLGRGDEHLKVIEEALAVKLTARGNVIAIQGSEAAESETRNVLDLLAEWVYAGEAVRRETVVTALQAVKEGSQREFLHLLTETVFTTPQGKVVRPKTIGQQRYIEAIRHHTLVLGMGPAGTGKTYLAIAMAVQALKSQAVERIILTRPAVEAGEKLGFLPGDLEEKVHPYLSPLYDALHQMLGVEAVDRARERGQIEIAPLAYMRGRTLHSSFIILDEAQNATYAQMKMFLTRLGLGSKIVVTGDATQVDLPRGERSGLSLAAKILGEVSDVSVVELSERDVVRHPLIARIIAAYERFEEGGEAEGHEHHIERA